MRFAKAVFRNTNSCNSVREELRPSANSLTRAAYIVSRKCGTSLLVIKENLWKTHLNFVKDALMVLLNLIGSAVKYSEEKQGA